MSDLISFAIRSLKIFKVFGFSAITIEDKRSVTKPIDIFFFVLNFSVGVIFLIASIKFKEMLVTRNDVVNFGNYVTYISALFIALTAMLIMFACRHKVWSMVLQLDLIDQKFKAVGFVEDPAKSGLIVSLVLFANITVSVPLTYVVYTLDGSLLKALLFLYTGFYYMLSVGSVVGLSTSSYARIETMNKICQSMIDQQNEQQIRVVKPFKSTSDIDKIGTLYEVYREIMRLHECINSCYGFSATLGSGLLFFFTNFTAFMTYKDIWINGCLSKGTIASILFALYLQIFGYAVIITCTLSERESQRTIRLSNAIIRRSQDSKLVGMLMSLNFLIKRTPPKFSCGLFDFDWSLVYGVSMKG